MKVLFFEHEQTINNPYNHALEIVSEQGRPIAVFGAGSLLPVSYYDKALALETSNAEQAFYYGCYRVVALGERPALTESEIHSIMQEYQTIYESLDYMNLRFLLKPHRAYHLTPLDYPIQEGGIHHIHIDIHDNRRPVFELPTNASFNGSLGRKKDGGCSFFDETTMFQQWYDNGMTMVDITSI